MTGKRKFDLQNWLEEKAQGPVYAMAVAAMVLRAALFYSGQGTAFEKMVGAFGMGLINGVTAIGLAMGGELLGSISGRSGRRNKAEAAEAAMRTDLKKEQRAALAAMYEAKAKTDFTFMYIGLLASFAAAMSYMLTSNPDHGLVAVGGEFVLTGLLLAIITYLGIFLDVKRKDRSQEHQEMAIDLSGQVVHEAGQRIIEHSHTIQDVRLFAGQLPKVARDRFLAAFASETPNDPMWTTTDLANWLGCNHSAGKRQLTRKLQRLQTAGQPITKNERGSYQLLRSTAILNFAEDFTAALAGGQVTPSVRTVPRPSGPATAQNRAVDSDTGQSPSGAGQAVMATAGAAAGAA